MAHTRRTHENEHPHIVPLATQSIELLETFKNITGEGDYLFPHLNNHTKSMSNNTIFKALERMGYKGTMTVHGFSLKTTVLIMVNNALLQ